MTTASLPPQPAPPPGVQYALTVPQSVLFADLSLRGNLRPAFHAVFGTDYEPSYIAIDDGAMSWNYTSDRSLQEALVGDGSAREGVARFLTAVSATARAVEKTAGVVGPGANRRPGVASDVVQDLREYWTVYEFHMTSLFTFWNVEHLLTAALTDALRAAGRSDEIATGLERFLRPSEENYFNLARRHIACLARRFRQEEDTASRDRGSALDTAIAHHIDRFGFLLAPFNLGAPPTPDAVLDQIRDAPRDTSLEDTALRVAGDPLMDLPPDVRELGVLAQQLAFWKTERLDALALSDFRATDLYRSAAQALDLTADELFAMTREEVERSFEDGGPGIGSEVLAARREAYCLTLAQGSIDFYEPTQTSEGADVREVAVGTQLRGIAASAGTATGRVVIVRELEEVSRLQPGDILVTTMTRPEMGTGLDRAAAFVTDQGGLMSHAAIISREMRKPCVIGTEDATLRLRDGMTVTVDGGEGVVTVDDVSAEE